MSWGKGIENDIYWGQGGTNNIGYGSIYPLSWSGETLLVYGGGSYVEELIRLFKERVNSYSFSVFEAESCLNDTLLELDSNGVLESSIITTTPTAYNNGKLYSVTPNTLLGDLDVLRNTTASRINSSRNIEDVDLNIPRLDYANESCPSILVEPQKTNLVTYSNQFGDASWVRGSTFISSNVTLSPNSSPTADYLSGNNASAQHSISKIPTSDSGAKTFSVFAKNAENRYLGLRIGTVGAIFDLVDGISYGEGTNITSSITSLNNGWYRCSITKSSSIANEQCLIMLSNGIFIGPNIFISSSVGLYIWGAQLEMGDLTSFVSTVSSIATRNADVITKNLLVGVSTITETFEDGSTNVISGSPLNYTMSNGRIKSVVAS